MRGGRSQMMLILQVRINKTISIAKATLPHAQCFCPAFIRLIFSSGKTTRPWQWDFQQLRLMSSELQVNKANPQMQPLQNRLDSALHFLGQLENETEKAWRPAKIAYTSTLWVLPSRERVAGRNVPHRTENGAIYLRIQWEIFCGRDTKW